MTQSSRAAFWLIVACGGAGSGATWRPCNDGGRHGRWVHGLPSFTYSTSRVTCDNLVNPHFLILTYNFGTSFCGHTYEK